MQKKLFFTILSVTVLFSACNKSSVALNNNPISINKETVVNKEQLALPSFSKLVKEVGNTVVNITCDIATQSKQQLPQFGMDPEDPFFELFKRAFPNQQPQQPELRKSFGSGFILSSDGFILTNAHVVDNAKKIIVRTTDKQELEAKLIGSDAKTDIALLKVSGKNLNAVKIGSPDNLDIGEWVAAIGAPFGFENTVTQGIVSAKGRSLPSDNYVPYIQTDVPINPGNSGGPLFNLNGQVVGINSQIYSRSGGYMGLSFSIPIDIAMNIANQLKQSGKVEHGLLGVQIQPVTDELAKSFGMNKVQGALVANITKGSAGEKAGIKVGDVILMADNKEINDANKLPLIIGNKKPGEKVELLVYRSGREIKLYAILDNANKEETEVALENKKPNSSDVVKLEKFGLEISNLDSAQLKRMGLINGILVTNSGGISQMAGIMAGDVILSVNNIIANDIHQVKRIVSSRRTIAILISRKSQQMFVTLNAQ